MARKKVVKTGVSQDIVEQATSDTAAALASAFDDFTVEKYGAVNPPAPYITPTGIKTLDALLGGGFISSAMIAFSSTPETGKSSIAYQFAEQFLKFHDNGLVVYFDVETSGSEVEANDSITVFHESRPEIFHLNNNSRFRYNRRPFTIKDFFEYLDGLIERKRQIQQNTGSEVKILFIVDSITTLSYSRLDAVEDFDEFYRK